MRVPNDPPDSLQDPQEGPFWWENEAYPEPDWRDILRGGTAREILHRLIEGDPFDLDPLCETILAEKAFLLEPERVFLRTAALIASNAKNYKGQVPLLDLVGDTIDQGIEELLEEDREGERYGYDIEPENRNGYMNLIPLETGIEAGRTRLATVVFNKLPEEQRRPFFSVVFEGLSVEEFAEFNGLSVASVADTIAQVTTAMIHGCDPLRNDPLGNDSLHNDGDGAAGNPPNRS